MKPVLFEIVSQRERVILAGNRLLRVYRRNLAVVVVVGSHPVCDDGDADECVGVASVSDADVAFDVTVERFFYIAGHLRRREFVLQRVGLRLQIGDGHADRGKDEDKDRDKRKQRFPAAQRSAGPARRTVFGVVHTACLPSLVLCRRRKDVDAEVVAVQPVRHRALVLERNDILRRA